MEDINKLREEIFKMMEEEIDESICLESRKVFKDQCPFKKQEKKKSGKVINLSDYR